MKTPMPISITKVTVLVKSPSVATRWFCVHSHDVTATTATTIKTKTTICQGLNTRDLVVQKSYFHRY